MESLIVANEAVMNIVININQAYLAAYITKKKSMPHINISSLWRNLNSLLQRKYDYFVLDLQGETVNSGVIELSPRWHEKNCLELF
jgi:hypothetical protein